VELYLFSPYMSSWRGKIQASCFRYTLISVILRKIFEPKWDDVAEEWRTIHNEELHNQYSSPNINRAIESRRMSWERICSMYR
jgi:hypothetical protein